MNIHRNQAEAQIAQIQKRADALAGSKFNRASGDQVDAYVPSTGEHVQVLTRRDGSRLLSQTFTQDSSGWFSTERKTTGTSFEVRGQQVACLKIERGSLLSHGGAMAGCYPADFDNSQRLEVIG